jgi:extracellular elastinolytic metalloproteinase
MRRYDARDFAVSRTSSERQAALVERAAVVSERLEGDHRVTVTGFDATTGNASCVTSHGAPAERGDIVLAALRHAITIAPVFGATGIAEFVPDPTVQRTSSGDRAVYLQQCHKGIPIFQSAITVRLDAQARISETVGSLIAVDRVEDALATVEDAVRTAARDLASAAAEAATNPETDQFGRPLHPAVVSLDGFTPVVRAAFGALAPTPTVLDCGLDWAPILASRTWFARDDALALAWDVALTSPGDGTVQRSIVGGAGATVLYAQGMTHGLRATASVYVTDGGSPRVDRPLPVAQSDYDALVPGASGQTSPRDWVQDTATAGNCTIAFVEADIETPVAGVKGADGMVRFAPGDATSDDQKVVNLFYYACVMHDLFYLLGFREAEGNFQVDNGGRAGAGSDRVIARVWRDPIPRTARFVTPADGSSPTMDMGPISAGGRHCAFDASVVYHEFTHGVSNRLVGGRVSTSALMSPQSLSMGEGWSDFVACSLLGSTTVGSWVADSPAGIRGFPYDSAFPDGFDKLGTGRYTSSAHNIGEIWCATLMEMGRAIGTPVALQLVIDAMKLSAANPSFLNMRDSILAAAAARAAQTAASGAGEPALVADIWSAFTKFGMGPKAACNGAQLAGIVADFEPPARGTSRP